MNRTHKERHFDLKVYKYKKDTGNLQHPLLGGNPAGTKQIRKFFKAKHGLHGTAVQAFAWWLTYNPEKR